MHKLKAGIDVINKQAVYYQVDRQGRTVRFKPWLGDSVSFLYDFIMRKSVFPRKFGGDVQRHYAILTQALAAMHGRQVLELATGAGSAVHFLDPDNVYTGIDISSGLLKRAARRFSAAGFSDSKFYVARAEDLPFNDIQFDLCLCILALNFLTMRCRHCKRPAGCWFLAACCCAASLCRSAMHYSARFAARCMRRRSWQTFVGRKLSIMSASQVKTARSSIATAPLSRGLGG